MRARTRRARVTAVVVVAGLVGSALLGAIAALDGGATVEIPAQGPWTVVFAGDMSQVVGCRDDPAVVFDYMTADQPSSSGGLVLAVDAEPADVQRVVACVARVIDPARISVVTSPVEERAA